MKNFFIIGVGLSFLLLNLEARVNPFIPSGIEKEIKKPIDKKVFYTPFISKNINLPSSARVLKEITVKYQNLDGSISTKSAIINRSVDWHKPLVLYQKTEQKIKDSFVKQKKNVTKSKIIKINPFLTVKIKNRKIFLKTKNRKIRHFMMVKPYKIIIDLKNSNDIVSKAIKIKASFIKNIIVGNHNGYYRVVFLLDGYYKYKLRKTSSGYLIILK